jgi:hypothetical protein
MAAAAWDSPSTRVLHSIIRPRLPPPPISVNNPSLGGWPRGTRETAGHQDAFWKGSGNNGLWETVWNHGWSGPRQVPSVSNVDSAPAVVVNGPRDEEDILWKGTDGQLCQDCWNGQWNTPHVITGLGELGLAPSLAVWPSGTRETAGQQDVFWRER